MTRFLLITLLLIAGCAVHLPPLPEDATAKRFEPLQDRAVIYLARHQLDRDYAAPVVLDDRMIGATYRGTYIRIELPAGPHQLRGYAGDSGSINLDTEPGQLYFVEQTTYGYRGSLSGSNFQRVDQARGRMLVMNGQLNTLLSQ